MDVKVAPVSDDADIKALVAGPMWSGTSLTYSFPSTAAQFTGYAAGSEPFNNFASFNPTQEAAVRWAFGQIASFTQLTFTESTGTDAPGAVLRFGMSDEPDTAYGYYPDPNVLGGDAWFNNSTGWYSEPQRGNYAWLTIMHEIGHTLGLEHPQDGNPPMSLDHDWLGYTVMSYRSYEGAPLTADSGFTNGDWGFSQSYMMDDIAALQFLYGANFNYRSGDTTYTWSPTTGQEFVNGVGQGAPGGNTVFMTVWDGGGNDTFDFSNYGSPVAIDLRPGSFTNFDRQLADLGQGSPPGNVATALLYQGDERSLIENAIGTSGDDLIDGNQVANRLVGGAGSDIMHGWEGNDLLDGGDGQDQLNGGDGDDTLVGGAESDSLQGGNGVDHLDGDDGNDTLWGDDGNDTLNGEAGNDYLIGGAGTDTLAGGMGDDAYIIDSPNDKVVELAGEGTDTVNASFSYILPPTIENGNLSGAPNGSTLTGNDLDNRLAGGATDNSFDGGAGADKMYGGWGNDTYYVDNSNDVVYDFTQDYDYSEGGDDTIYASVSYALMSKGEVPSSLTSDFGIVLGTHDFPGVENLILTGSEDLDGRGNYLANMLVGNAGANVLSGLQGNDNIDGGAGADSLYGGTGNDTFHVDQQADLVFENVGEGTDTVDASAGYYLFDNIENLILDGGAGGIFGVGNALANAITGNEGSNLLIGGSGNDTIHGGDGNDSLFGQDGADKLYGDAGTDYLVGGIGNDSLDGGAGPDALYGEDGNDVLIGGATFDTDILVGGAGADVLHGDSGLGDYDRMDGGAGNDTYYVDTGDDLTFEAAKGGIDTVYANVAGENNGVYLYANVENLVLLGTTTFGVGNELANQLTGNDSANWLLGGEGNDIIDGGKGNDVLFGQGGSDTFAFEQGTGGDVIGDFTHGEDKIDVHAFGFASFVDLATHFSQADGDGAFDLGGGDFVVLQGVTMASLDAGDFVL